MGNEWNYIHHAIRKENVSLNVEILEEDNPWFKYIYGYGKDDYIRYQKYRNTKYIASLNRDKHKILKLLKKKHIIYFYSNYVIINGQTFNGISREIIDDLVMQLYSPPEPKIKELEYDVSDFEFEDY